ncbi:hypothetical protein OE749_00450 [Aestuariibacter sp. AA17]|uniref:Lipoprotein n=1 Tax=Fluctibacter corallii TaxID=2984329 RepID=A0ABT3A3Q2_9ALTE|nr:hypothetical protein [Aestuariibacter sp. AA17]MCV2883164.1 hypothetical protein [Aestuariibacter sp. AA17]
MKKRIVVLAAISLFGCSSEELETQNFGSDMFKSDYYFLNATQHELSYHMRNAEIDGDDRDPTDNKYRVAELAQRGAVSHVVHEHNAGRKVNMLAHAPLSNGIEERLAFKADLDKHYNVVNWQNQGNISMSVFERRTSNKEAIIRTRLFVTEPDISIKVNGETITTSLGKVTDFFDVEHCQSTLEVNESFIDVCDASFGDSYLVILSADGLVNLFRES